MTPRQQRQLDLERRTWATRARVDSRRRAVANGAAAGGCLTTITATLATGLALVAVVWKAGRR